MRKSRVDMAKIDIKVYTKKYAMRFTNPKFFTYNSVSFIVEGKVDQNNELNLLE